MHFSFPCCCCFWIAEYDPASNHVALQFRQKSTGLVKRDIKKESHARPQTKSRRRKIRDGNLPESEKCTERHF